LWLVTHQPHPDNRRLKHQEFLVESIAIGLGIFALTLLAVSWHAARMGNERRDVVALGACGATFGVGAIAVALI
jgi:hypothetical protein